MRRVIGTGKTSRRTLLLSVVPVLALLVGGALYFGARRPAEPEPGAFRLTDRGPKAEVAAEARRIAAAETVRAFQEAVRTGNSASAAKLAPAIVGLGPEAVTPIGDALRDTRHWDVRRSLLGLLAMIRSAEAIRTAEDFYMELKPAETALKTEVVRCLGRVGGRSTRDVLLRLLSTEESPAVREEIAKAMLALGLTPEEAGRLADADKALVEPRAKENEAVRSRLESIQKLDAKSPSSLPALQAAATREKVIAVALAAFSKLETRNDAEAVAILREPVVRPPATSEDQILRSNALVSLARMTVSDARLAIRAAALGDDADLRVHTVEVLGACADRAMMPLLDQAVARDPSERMRLAVERARTAIASRSEVRTR